jgi:sugar lactone lactonase YvrE
MTRLLAPLTLALLCSLPAGAQGTHLWSQSSAAEFERGTPDGVAISSLGELTTAPAARALVTTGSTFVWSVAADKAGNAYLATGSPATMLRVTPTGVQTKLFSTKDLTVQVVRVGPDGAIYAATLPSGRVYRLDSKQVDQDETKATVVFDPAQTAEKPKYIWDLQFDSQGRLYIATGAPGAIYRVELSKPAAKPELVYASDEPHFRALLFAPNGDLFSGSDGSGLVYRISPDGKAFVIFEAAKREITALALGKQGQLYVAAVGERGRSPLPPLPVTGGASVTTTITIVAPGSVQAFNGNTVIPEGSDVYVIPAAASAGAPHRIWSSHDDILYALDATPDGLLAASGNRGHIYRIEDDGSSSDIGHLLASQVTGFAATGAGLYAATANSGKLYLLSAQAAGEQASYESDIFDAQVTAQWGRAEVLARGSYQLYARTGNVENPLRGWTDWKLIGPETAEPGLTPARYLQWKAVLSPGATISSVGINYLPANVAPVVDEIVVVPGTRVNSQGSQPQFPQQTSISFASQGGSQNFEPSASNGPLAAVRDKSAVTARWAAHDDNGDDLTFSLYYQPEGEAYDHTWRLLKDKLTERFYTFDASLLPDGAYRMKVVASDAPSHPAGEALTGEHESASFLIDTATPAITGLAAIVSGGGLNVTATATDAATPIARAEYSVDAGPWQYVQPAGQISDSLVEHYDFSIPLDAAAGKAPHTVTLRVFDRYENAAAAKTIAR